MTGSLSLKLWRKHVITIKKYVDDDRSPEGIEIVVIICNMSSFEQLKLCRARPAYLTNEILTHRKEQQLMLSSCTKNVPCLTSELLVMSQQVIIEKSETKLLLRSASPTQMILYLQCPIYLRCLEIDYEFESIQKRSLVISS